MDKTRIVVLTNLLAPYRISLWTKMGIKSELSVVLTGGANPHRWENRSAVIEHHPWSLFILMRIHFQSRTKPSKTLIIHPLMQFRYLVTSMLAKIFGWKLIFFYESTIETSRINSGIKFTLKRLIFKFPDAVITVGQRSTANVKSLRVLNRKIFELFNAIDSELVVNSKPEQADLIMRSGHKFLFVGQLIPRKNIENILFAFKKYRKSNDSLTIIGSGHMMNKLVILTEELGLTQNVTFKGMLNQDATYAEYFMHDTLIMPSTEEVWGLVAQEALTAGMHVVVSSVSGICDLIANFEGVHICSTDLDSIGSAMQDCLKHWADRVKSPEILRYDTNALSEKFLEIVNLLNVSQTVPKNLAK